MLILRPALAITNRLRANSPAALGLFILVPPIAKQKYILLYQPEDLRCFPLVRSRESPMNASLAMKPLNSNCGGIFQHLAGSFRCWAAQRSNYSSASRREGCVAYWAGGFRSLLVLDLIRSSSVLSWGQWMPRLCCSTHRGGRSGWSCREGHMSSDQ